MNKKNGDLSSIEIDKNNMIGIGSNGNRVYKVKNKYTGNVSFSHTLTCIFSITL